VTKNIKTKTVTGRRELHYASYDEALQDMQRLNSQGFQTLGNWSFGQILDHLARSVNKMIDGTEWKMGAVGQFFMRLLMKKRFLNGPLIPGFQIPKAGAAFLPDDISADEGLARLTAAVARLKEIPDRAENGALGKLTNEEWDQFQLNHFALHMSFVLPA
jgi:Protein of unknown function (DUF1569)